MDSSRISICWGTLVGYIHTADQKVKWNSILDQVLSGCALITNIKFYLMTAMGFRMKK